MAGPGVTNSAPSVDEVRFRGQPAMRVAAGDLSATFLPDLGMTGVSLRCRGREHLALPGGLAALRAGATLGIPLLAPWANRLASRRYRAAGVDVDLDGLPLGTDGNGLPIHGLLVGRPGWRLGRRSTRARPGELPRRDRRRRPGVPVPAPHRGDRRRPRAPARRSTRRHPDRAAGGAGRLRMAPVPAPARHAATPLAPAAAGAHPPRARRAGHPDRRRAGRARRGRTDRPAHVRRPLPPRPRPRPRAGRRRRRDLDARRGRVPVRPGVGAGRPPVRRARADDGPRRTASSTARRRWSSRATPTPPRSPSTIGGTDDDEGIWTMSTTDTRRPRW